jgi:hypothetical protein
MRASEIGAIRRGRHEDTLTDAEKTEEVPGIVGVWLITDLAIRFAIARGDQMFKAHVLDRKCGRGNK